jgi:hypothetical protein
MYDTYQQRITECDQQLQTKPAKKCSAIRAPRRTAARHGSRSDAHRRDGSPDSDQ